MTERQAEILAYIREHVDTHGFPPTIREIGKAVGISSTSVCNYHLNKLKEAGRLIRRDCISRGLIVVQDGEPPVPVTLGADVVVVIDGRERVGAFARLAA